jgi:hypothetical protein
LLELPTAMDGHSLLVSCLPSPTPLTLQYSSPTPRSAPVFLNTGAERPSGLSCVFHITCGATNLVYCGVSILVLVRVVFFVSSFLSVLFVECVTTRILCVFENFSDGSCFLAYISEFGPLRCLCARHMFMVATFGFSYGCVVSVVT